MIFTSLIGTLLFSSSAFAVSPRGYKCDLPGTHVQLMKPGVSSYVGFGVTASCSIIGGLCYCTDSQGKKCGQSGLLSADMGSCSVQVCEKTKKKSKTSRQAFLPKTFACVIMPDLHNTKKPLAGSGVLPSSTHPMRSAHSSTTGAPLDLGHTKHSGNSGNRTMPNHIRPIPLSESSRDTTTSSFTPTEPRKHHSLPSDE